MAHCSQDFDIASTADIAVLRFHGADCALLNEA
jgi:hypothetical protein